jgi:hypothetical protein
VSGHIVTRRISIRKREGVVGSWSQSNFHVLSNIIRVIKSRRMSYAENEVRMAEIRNACSIFVRKLEGKNH